MFKIEVKENDVNKRLDNFIAKCYPNLLKVLINKLIRTKKIKVNQKKVENNYRLQINDEINFYVNEDTLNNKNHLIYQKYEPKLSFMNASNDLEVIYEDQNLLIVNKPAGILSHSSHANEYNAIIDQIKKYLYKKNEYDLENENTFAPALSNRLDRNTSGLVIASKNYLTLKRINEAIKNKEIKKFYYTYVYGKFEQKEGILKHYLKKDEKNNIALVFDKKEPNTKIAILKYKVIAYYPTDDISMLEIELLTGRFHQIRAQLSYINHPLVGDGKYYFSSKHNYKKQNFKNQILVAYKLLFEKSLANYFFHINENMAFQISDIYKKLKETYKFK